MCTEPSPDPHSDHDCLYRKYYQNEYQACRNMFVNIERHKLQSCTYARWLLSTSTWSSTLWLREYYNHLEACDIIHVAYLDEAYGDGDDDSDVITYRIDNYNIAMQTQNQEHIWNHNL